MKNPWEKFEYTNPYILQSEIHLINIHNRRTKNFEFKIHTDLLPEPYFGNINADVVLLGLNPGVSSDESRYNCVTEHFISTHKKNLLHEH